jgi:hypothetical protein
MRLALLALALYGTLASGGAATTNMGFVARYSAARIERTG